MCVSITFRSGWYSPELFAQLGTDVMIAILYVYRCDVNSLSRMVYVHTCMYEVKHRISIVIRNLEIFTL